MIRRAIRRLSNDMLRRLTSYASVIVAATLIVAKAWAYYTTDSVALLSSLVDSGVDMLASLITAYGVIVALRPPDHNHRYGHGKAEALAALAQSVFILVSSGLLIKEAAHRFISPAPIQNIETGYLVMSLAIVLTVLLLALQSYAVKRTKSLAIASDRLHYVGDVLINLAVVVTFAFQDYFKANWIDPLFALAIAGGMCVGAVKIAYGALNVLMDKELPDNERSKILAIAQNVKGVCGAHDLRTRMDVGRYIIEIHIEMDPHISLHESHEITEAVTAAIQAIYRNADILIHQDPFGIKEPRLDAEIEGSNPVQ
ncbi:MAG: cation diffusion facilitator family transporter [Alphaproteobacteria bacterium]|nr:cation diffusion facilitator family transporter [Alphaproteobacteria bacterium]